MEQHAADVDHWFDAGVSVITMQALRSDNRLTMSLLQQLSQALHDTRARSDCRAVLLRSAGAFFCSGMDIGRVAEHISALGANPELPPEVVAAVSLYGEILLTLHTMPIPVVCLLGGAAIGGGVGLAAACDIVYALPTATLQMSETLFGLVPANVMPYLLGSRISLQKARYLIFTARRIDSNEARELNLIDHIVDSQHADRELKALFKQLLRSGPRALAEAKQLSHILVHSDIAGDIHAAAELTKATLLRLLTDEEPRAALAAYMEGGSLPWIQPYRPTRTLHEQHQMSPI